MSLAVGMKVFYVPTPSPPELVKAIALFDQHFPSRRLRCLPLFTNTVYTIRDIDSRAVHELYQAGMPTVRLMEVLGPIQIHVGMDPWEIGYPPFIFRPISTTYLEEFDKLRVPLKGKVKVKS